MASDEEIIRRVKKGHADDFRELLVRYQARVYRLAYGILRSREEAEDAVQEVFVRVYKNLDAYKDRGFFWAWIRRITVNSCLTKLTRALPTVDIDDVQEAWNSCKGIEAGILITLEIEEIMQAVAQLPAAYRTVIVLRYEEDLACNEIAEILGEPAGAVRTRLYRAHKMLAAKLVVKDEV